MKRVSRQHLIPLVALLALAAPAAGQDSDECLECHADQQFMVDTVDPFRAGLVLDAELFHRSVHDVVDCTGCHFGFEEIPHELEAVESATCVDCHDEVLDVLGASVHAPLVAEGALDCMRCHGVHDVLPRSDPASRLSPLAVTRTCGQCHFDGLDTATASDAELFAQHYADDSHADGILHAGLVVSADCVSCHGGHDVLADGDPASRLAPARVAQTCGSCHAGLLPRYEQSVHFAALGDGLPGGAGERRGATCVDCHKPHEIAPTDGGSFRVGMVDNCGGCHPAQSQSFFETVHGKVTRLGGERAAKCQDCHGSHELRAPDDPASTLSPLNITATCAQCHAGAHPDFTTYAPHATTDDPERWPWMFWSFWGMTTLLVGTMSVALLHTLLFLVRLLLDRKHWKAHQAALAQPGADLRLYRRFDRSVRTLHLLMVVAFITLAASGMALKFSHTEWAALVTRAFGGLETMAVLHRLAALLLLGVFAWHVRSVLAMKRERGLTWLQLVTGPRSILFNQREPGEIKATLAWFFGRGPRPRYGRFTYWEKFDYFAVFWGVAIIGLTGLMLWFPVTATRIVPGWMLNVADIIHGDEALLAVAFIFTVHFFNANLRPDKFPMDMTMFTGRMTVEELKYERPAEYDDLVARGELEQHLVAPLPVASVRAFRVFASLALLTGLGLIALIAWALLGL